MNKHLNNWLDKVEGVKVGTTNRNIKIERAYRNGKLVEVYKNGKLIIK